MHFSRLSKLPVIWILDVNESESWFHNNARHVASMLPSKNCGVPQHDDQGRHALLLADVNK
jgi:hypothetical protein